MKAVGFGDRTAAPTTRFFVPAMVMVGVIGWANTSAAFNERGRADFKGLAETQVSQADTRRFEIPAQSLASALIAFGEQAGLQVTVDGTLVAGREAPAVSGLLAPEAALELLLAESGITWRFVGADIVLLEGPITRIDQAEDGAQILAPVEVVGKLEGNADPDRIYRTPSSGTVVTREQIERHPVRDTSDVFRQTTGVWTSVDRQNPGLAVNIRGLQDFGRVNVTVNGARQNYQEAGHGVQTRAYVDPGLMARVDVEKTATSGAGGAGTIGGQVAFRTLNTQDIVSGQDTYGAFADATVGGNGYDFSGKTGFGGYINDWLDISAALSHKKTGAYDPGSGDPVVAINDTCAINPLTCDPNASDRFEKIRLEDLPDRDLGQDQLSGVFNVNLAPMDGLDLGASYVGYGNEWKTGTGQFIDENQIVAHTVTTSYFWQPQTPWMELEGNNWFTRTLNSQYRPERDSYGAFDVDYRTDGYGSDLTYRSRLQFGDISGVAELGGEYFRDDTRTEAAAQTDGDGRWFSAGTPEGLREVMSGFSQVRLGYADWVEAAAGLRYDTYEIEGEGFFFDNNLDEVEFNANVEDDSGFLPTASFAVSPIQGLQFFGTYSEGFRPPSIMETVLHGEHIGGISAAGTFVPNPNLKPEESQTWEVGVNVSFNQLLMQSDSLRIKTAYFNTKVENYIALANVYLPGTPADIAINQSSNFRKSGYVNLDGTARFHGLEAQAAYDAGLFFMGAGYTLTHSKFGDSYDPFILGGKPDTFQELAPGFEQALGIEIPVPGDEDYIQWIYGTPDQKWNLEAGVRLFEQRLQLGARMNYVGSTKGNIGLLQVGSTDFKSYRVFDTYATFSLSPDFKLHFAVDNLTDEAYVDAGGLVSMPAPGRTASLTFSMKF